MPIRSKLNSVAALVLAIAFYWFFMFTKHDARVAPIVPFADDPYDASGSFCLIVSVLLAVISLARAFRRYAPEVSSQATSLLARTQAAIATGVLVTLMVDSVALARHTPQWISKAGSPSLLEAMGAIAAFSAVLLVLIRTGAYSSGNRDLTQWRKAVAGILATAAIAAVFPEGLISLLTGHLFAILLGFALVAAPQSMLATAILPCPVETLPREARRRTTWSLVALFGAIVGASALAVEWSEGTGAMPATQMAIVAGFFIVAGTGVFVVGFAFLAKPLGLFRKLTAPSVPMHEA